MKNWKVSTKVYVALVGFFSGLLAVPGVGDFLANTLTNAFAWAAVMHPKLAVFGALVASAALWLKQPHSVPPPEAQNAKPFVPKAALAILLALCLVSYGCSAAEWITTAENDLPVIVSIATSILNIADVAAVPAAQAAGAQAKIDLALAQQLVTQFKAGDKGTTLSEVNSALAAVNTDFNAILKAIHVNNPSKQAAITAAVGVALSTLLAIESLIPANAGTSTTVTGAIKASVAKVGIEKPPSASSVKAKYNTVIKGQYPSAVIK